MLLIDISQCFVYKIEQEKKQWIASKWRANAPLKTNHVHVHWHLLLTHKRAINFFVLLYEKKNNNNKQTHLYKTLLHVYLF